MRDGSLASFYPEGPGRIVIKTNRPVDENQLKIPGRDDGLDLIGYGPVSP